MVRTCQFRDRLDIGFFRVRLGVVINSVIIYISYVNSVIVWI